MFYPTWGGTQRFVQPSLPVKTCFELRFSFSSLEHQVTVCWWQLNTCTSSHVNPSLRAARAALTTMLAITPSPLLYWHGCLSPMPLFISAPVNWSGGEFFCGGATFPLCCVFFIFFLSGARVRKGLREKDNAACFNSSNSQTLRHWQGRENISCDTVTLCKNLGEAAAAVTHLVVSSTAYDCDSARPLVRQSSWDSSAVFFGNGLAF